MNYAPGLSVKGELYFIGNIILKSIEGQEKLERGI
jgi:hypothetical protein